jgi:hypothetical protein
MQLRQWEFWETLRRHTKYKELCAGIVFLPTGIINPAWSATADNQKLLMDRRSRIQTIFGVKGILDPSRKYDKLPGGAVGEVSPESVTIVETDLRHGQYLEDGKYIRLKIDVTIPFDETVQMIKAYVDLQSAMAEIKPHATRTAFYEALEAFQVYDLKAEGKTGTEIVKELWPVKFKRAYSSDRGAEHLYQKVTDRYRAAKKRINRLTK